MKPISRISSLSCCFLLVIAGSTMAQDPPRLVDIPPEDAVNSDYVHSNGYVCEVLFLPKSVTYAEGNYGTIQATFYSQPFCGGSMLRGGAFYSKGAPYGDQNFQYSEAGLDRLYDSLDHAAQTGRKVRYSCWSISFPCAYVRFFGK